MTIAAHTRSRATLADKLRIDNHRSPGHTHHSIGHC